VITRRDAPTGASGQALVIMVGAMFAVMVMVGLIIDGGNAWAQQRIVQNGSDAAAEAGAVIMGQRFAGATPPVGGWDAAVLKAITDSAAANGITVTSVVDGKTNAYYTDICGVPVQPDGSPAWNAKDHSYNLTVAARVGEGLPDTITTTPNCPSHIVGPATGVIVLGHKDARTYIVSIAGINTWSVNTQSTAAAGYLQESCAASQGCAVLPIAIPVNVLSCNGSNNPVNTGLPWNQNQVYKVPLCQNGPGNVGLLDWTPTAGGTSELINSITTPDNPLLTFRPGST
jgi:hypothetical protein